MTTTEHTASENLQQQLDNTKAQVEANVPPAVWESLNKGIQDLIQQNIAAHAPKVGDHAPDFTLPNAQGKPVTLSTLLQRGPVALIFYRGEWCPYCNVALHAYQNILPQIHELGGTLIAVSPQTPDHSLSLVEKAHLAFPVLSDVGNTVARQFGLVFSFSEDLRKTFNTININLADFNGDDAWELPIPGSFVIDQQGVIRLAFVDPDFTRRLEPAQLLEGLRTAR
ncbi:MAG TPA: peroxiredoxin-like family protein [Ktedonobacteraceae bacterium]